MIKGRFTDKHGNDYVYRVTDWFSQDHRKHKAGNYTPKDFMVTDKIWVETMDMHGGKRFTTVMGPFEDRDFIEDILEYDYTEYTSTNAE